MRPSYGIIPNQRGVRRQTNFHTTTTATLNSNSSTPTPHLWLIFFFAICLLGGLCLLWHRMFALPHIAPVPYCENNDCSQPPLQQPPPPPLHYTPPSTSSRGHGATGVVIISIFLVLGLLLFWGCGSRGNGSRDAGDSHRVYPPGAFFLAAVLPILGCASLGIFLGGFQGFLLGTFIGVLPAIFLLTYMISAPEIAGGGAYIKAN